MKRIAIGIMALAFLILLLNPNFPGRSALSGLMQKARAQVAVKANTQPIEAKSALLIDQVSGTVLYSQNPTERVYPASTTKIMTALLALENSKPDEWVIVGNEVKKEDREESSAGLTVGQRLSMQDLLEALMLPSGNDAARVIAVHIARKTTNNPQMNEEQAINYFSNMMNRRAKLAGAADSNFVNPHGLQDKNHYTTAMDLAKISKEAMNNNTFRSIVKQPSTSFKSEKGSKEAIFSFKNTNLLIQKNSPYYLAEATGLKTGFTDQAGYCLIASASKGSKSYISIIMGSTEDEVWKDSRSLLEYGLEGKEL